MTHKPAHTQSLVGLEPGFKCVLQGALYFLHQVRIVRNFSNLLRVWTDRAAAAVARSHWNTFAVPHDTSKLIPPSHIFKCHVKRHNVTIYFNGIQFDADAAARSVHSLKPQIPGLFENKIKIKALLTKDKIYHATVI